MNRMPRDDYYVLMWNWVPPLFSRGKEKAQQAIQRFRDLACNSCTIISCFVNLPSFMRSLKTFDLPADEKALQEVDLTPFREANFPFYLMNIGRPLYWNWGQAKPVFRAQYETFARERDRRVFQKKACLNDPKVIDGIRTRIDELMDSLKDVRDLSLFYDLRDEPSVTSFLLASDLCFCEHCLTRMREWLKAQYGTLASLNAEWGTQFSSWDAVEPLTTLEALDRRDAGTLNFAPWADHRQFMNWTFARTFDEMTQRIRRHDPEALCGPCGTQCPSVFGGYDFSQIVAPTGWVEAYEFGCSVDCYRSFKPRREFPILKTSGLGGGADAVRLTLWTYVYQSGGYSGTIIWNAHIMVDVESEALPPKSGAEQLRDIFAELRAGVPRLVQRTDEISSPVAVHYSHASINADFITSVPNRPVSVAGFENDRSLSCKSRVGWWNLLEDRGLRPVFISSQQIEAGELLKRGLKVLILPRSIAISDAEAAAMREFVEQGGVLAADSYAGRMDEHCREREAGILDDLFGVKRADRSYHGGAGSASFRWDAQPGKRPRWGDGTRLGVEAVEDLIQPAGDVQVAGCTEMTDAALGIVARRGRGTAILLNAAPIEYPDARRNRGVFKAMQAFFGRPIELAGVTPEATVTDPATGEPLPGWRVWSFRHGAATYFGVAPDPGLTQDTLGAVTVLEGGRTACTVRLRFAAAGHVYEARSGRSLGEGDTVVESLGPTDAPLYAVLPYKVESMDLRFDGKSARATLKTTGETGEHVFRFDLLEAKGARLLDGGANVVAFGGVAEWVPAGPLPRGGKLSCRDVASGVRAEIGVRNRD